MQSKVDRQNGKVTDVVTRSREALEVAEQAKRLMSHLPSIEAVEYPEGIGFESHSSQLRRNNHAELRSSSVAFYSFSIFN